MLSDHADRKISKEMANLNHTADQMALTDKYRTFRRCIPSWMARSSPAHAGCFQNSPVVNLSNQ
jgi:hypothetical protein